MMKIEYTPQLRTDASWELGFDGDVLEVNGQKIDMSVIPEGGIVLNAHEVHDVFAYGSSIERVNGDLCFTLIRPYGLNDENN